MTATQNFTNCVADAPARRAYHARVLSTEQFLAEIRDRAEKDADVGRVLGLPSSRVAELFSGKRRLLYHEAKQLADHFMPEQSGGSINEELLSRLLHALGPSVPKSGISGSAAQALASALSHGLELLQATGAIDPTDREFAMAVRAATSRYHEASQPLPRGKARSRESRVRSQSRILGPVA